MASKTSTSASIALFLLLNTTLFLTATSCPIDALKPGVCVDVLNSLLNLTIGKPPKEPCCSLLLNLAGAEAAVCLCTTIKARLAGLNLLIPVDLSQLINYCGQNVPEDWKCP